MPKTYAPHELTDDLAKAAEAERTGTPVLHGNSMPGKSAQPGRMFITVAVKMPHVTKYNRKPEMRLTYGTRYVVQVGDIVLCPPTRLNPKWTRGVVIDLSPSGYRGPVKYVKPLGTPSYVKGGTVS